MVKKGIIDPTKVVRQALQGASSVAGLLITTEAMVAELPKKKDMPSMPPGGGGMDRYFAKASLFQHSAELENFQTAFRLLAGSAPGPFARKAGSIRLLWSVPIPSHDVLLQDPFDFGDGRRICY